jgi:hypothetical protein
MFLGVLNVKRIIVAEEFDYIERQRRIEALCLEYPFLKKTNIEK